jgi:hypothetical protein
MMGFLELELRSGLGLGGILLIHFGGSNKYLLRNGLCIQVYKITGIQGCLLRDRVFHGIEYRVEIGISVPYSVLKSTDPFASEFWDHKGPTHDTIHEQETQ